MPTKLLPIEHEQQEHPVGCLAACVQMALAHIGIQQTQHQLNRLLGLTALGVPMSRVYNLQNHKFRSGFLGFQSRTINVTYQAGSKYDIQTTITKDLPVILSVQAGELQSYWQRASQHALLCIGYDDKYVYLNDPAFADAPQKVVWDELLLAWLEFDYMYAVVFRG